MNEEEKQLILVRYAQYVLDCIEKEIPMLNEEDFISLEHVRKWRESE